MRVGYHDILSALSQLYHMGWVAHTHTHTHKRAGGGGGEGMAGYLPGRLMYCTFGRFAWERHIRQDIRDKKYTCYLKRVSIMVVQKAA